MLALAAASEMLSGACPGLYARSRALDPANAWGMDRYALLLRDRGDQSELSRLWQDLRSCAGSRPETCVAGSAYWEASGHFAQVLALRFPCRLAMTCPKEAS